MLWMGWIGRLIYNLKGTLYLKESSKIQNLNWVPIFLGKNYIKPSPFFLFH